MAKNAEETEKPEKIFPDQLDGEEVLFMFRKHPIVMRKGLVLCMLGPLLGVLPAAIFPQLGFGWFFGGLAGGFVVGALIMLPSWINWYYSMYIVTDRRLIQITQRGLFKKSFVDLGLSQIQSLNYEINGLQATLLGYGTILVQTYVGDLVIHEVHHPAKLYKKLITILHDEGVTPVERPIQEGEELDLEEET
jgi:hypothetical protein